MEDQKEQNTKKKHEKDADNNIPKNEIQNAVSNSLNNPFIMALLTNSVMMNLLINEP